MGVASQTSFEWQADVLADDLTSFSNALNVRLGGRIIEDIVAADNAEVAGELGVSDEVRVAVVTAMRHARQSNEPQLAASGTQNLLDQPEFHDLRKLRTILRIVEEQKTLYDLVADEVTRADMSAPMVKIGHELGEDAMAECSLVTVPYRFGNRGIGMLAILGPRRMPYGRLMALASGTADSLGAYLESVEIR
jgi:heat-inducible transcriptional repressor